MQGIVLGLEIAERAERNRNRKAMFLGQVALVAAAVLFLIVSQTSGLAAAIGIGGLIFVSSAAVGGMFGFLFSVPLRRTRCRRCPTTKGAGRRRKAGAEIERSASCARIPIWSGSPNG